MADRSGKTEKPTASRKRKARKEGQIARSQDLVSWMGVLVATYVLPGTLRRGAALGRELFADLHQVMLDPSVPRMTEAATTAMRGIGPIVMPVMAGAVAIAIVGNVAQVGLVLSSKALKPSLKRLNPMVGVKRMFSSRNAFELGKNMAKLSVITALSYPAIRGIVTSVPHDRTLPFWELASIVGDRGLALVRRVAQVALAIAVGDYVYQRRSIGKALKMTKQEVRDEARQAEGNQEVKGQIKARQREMSRNRMLAMVRDADVVVVNPIHIAVALRYEPERGAPRVIAKGKGFVAERIREEAEKHRVALVESIPLARALYAAVEIDQEIPLAFYEPVARLMAFVHRLGKRRPMGGPFHRLPPSMDMAETPAR
jgi:flagellar biosynthesis protein FlhB